MEREQPHGSDASPRRESGTSRYHDHVHCGRDPCHENGHESDHGHENSGHGHGHGRETCEDSLT